MKISSLPNYGGKTFREFFKVLNNQVNLCYQGRVPFVSMSGTSFEF